MNRRNFYLVCIGVLLTFAVPIIPYIWFFKSSVISSSTADWGAFGSYISGVIGPVLSFASIISVFMLSKKQINQTDQKSQEDLKQLRQSMNIEHELKVFDDAFNTIFTLIFRTMPSEIMLKDVCFLDALIKYAKAGSPPSFQFTEDLNRLHFQDVDKELIFQRQEKIFELLATYIQYVGEERTREIFKNSKNGFIAQLRNDLNSTSSNIRIMLLSADRLNKLGHSSLLLKYRFTTICELSMLLAKLNIIDAHTINMLSLYWSQPDQSTNRMKIPNDVKENLFERFVAHFGSEVMGNIDSWNLGFEQFIESSRKTKVTRYSLTRGEEVMVYDLNHDSCFRRNN